MHSLRPNLTASSFSVFALAGCIINEGMSSRIVIPSFNQTTNPNTYQTLIKRADNVSLSKHVFPDKLPFIILKMQSRAFAEGGGYSVDTFSELTTFDLVETFKTKRVLFSPEVAEVPIPMLRSKFYMGRKLCH